MPHPHTSPPRRAWPLVFRHRDPLPGYAALDWPARKRLDLLVLLLALRRRWFWRGTFLLGALLVLLQALRWRWALGGPWADLLHCLGSLPLLPAAARGRRRLLRVLLWRRARLLAGAGTGCCNSPHADPGKVPARHHRSGARDRAGGDRRRRAAGRSG